MKIQRTKSFGPIEFSIVSIGQSPHPCSINDHIERDPNQSSSQQERILRAQLGGGKRNGSDHCALRF